MTNSAAQPPSDGSSSSSTAAGAAQAVPKRDKTALTEKQQAVWDLTRPVSEGGQGKTRAEAAAILGISAPVVSKTIQVCYRKKGVKRVAGQMQSVEVKNPEKAAALIDIATNPELELKFGKLSDAMREAGLPPAASQAIIRRLRTKFYGAVTAVRNLKTQEILDMLGQKIHLALTYMDDKVMGEASFRDLALGTTAMIEKRQLLRGEPTQIVSDAERAKLHELLPLAIAEARRRGLTLEGAVTEKLVEPA